MEVSESRPESDTLKMLDNGTAWLSHNKHLLSTTITLVITVTKITMVPAHGLTER